MRQRLRKKVFWKIEKFEDWLLDHRIRGREWPDWLYSLNTPACVLLGHTEPMTDCGIPGHWYCAWCGSSLPDPPRENGKWLT